MSVSNDSAGPKTLFEMSLDALYNIYSETGDRQVLQNFVSSLVYVDNPSEAIKDCVDRFITKAISNLHLKEARLLAPSVDEINTSLALSKAYGRGGITSLILALKGDGLTQSEKNKVLQFILTQKKEETQELLNPIFTRLRSTFYLAWQWRVPIAAAVPMLFFVLDGAPGSLVVSTGVGAAIVAQHPMAGSSACALACALMIGINEINCELLKNDSCSH